MVDRWDRLYAVYNKVFNAGRTLQQTDFHNDDTLLDALSNFVAEVSEARNAARQLRADIRGVKKTARVAADLDARDGYVPPGGNKQAVCEACMPFCAYAANDAKARGYADGYNAGKVAGALELEDAVKLLERADTAGFSEYVTDIDEDLERDISRFLDRVGGTM